MGNPTDRVAHLLAALLLCLAVSTAALAGSPRYYPRGGSYAAKPGPEFRLRLGLYSPSGDGGEFWKTEQSAFTGSVDDFEDLIFGVDFLLPLHPYYGVLFTTSWFDSGQTRIDRRYVDQDGNDISFRSDLQLIPLTAAFVVYLTPPTAAVRPYAGGGGGLYWWEYSEGGDFVVDGTDIVTTYYLDNGVEFGFFVLLGLDIRLAPGWSLIFEGRWTALELDVGGDFTPYGGDFDVGGWEATAGFAWKF